MSRAYINLLPYPGTNNNQSKTYGAAAARGVPLGDHATDATQYDLAGPTNFAGFLTRDVTVAGPVLADHVYPGRIELPFKAGGEVSVELADRVEVGSSQMVLSGTGALATTDTPGTVLSFSSGKWYKAQPGDKVFFTLESQVTPDSGETVRIRARRV